MRQLAVTLGLALMVAGISPDAASAQRTLYLYGVAGGATSVNDLDDAETTSLSSEFTGGGGIGYQFSKVIGIRGDIMFSQPSVEGSGLTGVANGSDMDRLFYGGEVTFSLPTSGRFVPFVGVGGGVVRLDPDQGGSFSEGAFRGSLGVNYRVPGADRLGILVQGTGWAYSFDRFGVDNNQFDIVYSAGISYSFRL